MFRRPVISLDLHPTALAAAGATIWPEWQLDGVDLLPHLTAPDSVPHDTLYWRFQEQRAIRRGDWKLVIAAQSRTWALYNLADDLGEQNDLAAKQPDKVRELQAAWEAWSAQLNDPQWPRQRPGRQGGAARLEGRFKQFDRNGDGTLTPDEFPRPRVFRQLDANHDEAVTLEEARAGNWGARAGGGQ